MPSHVQADTIAEAAAAAAAEGLARALSGSPAMSWADTAAVAAELARLRVGKVSADLSAQGAARVGDGQAGRAKRP